MDASSSASSSTHSSPPTSPLVKTHAPYFFYPAPHPAQQMQFYLQLQYHQHLAEQQQHHHQQQQQQQQSPSRRRLFAAPASALAANASCLWSGADAQVAAETPVSNQTKAARLLALELLAAPTSALAVELKRRLTLALAAELHRQRTELASALTETERPTETSA
jgi:hypothetical protein